MRAYPQALCGSSDNELRWCDGSTSLFDEGPGAAGPDLKTQMAQPYPAGQPLAPPAAGSDPGRARSADFFTRMYGHSTAEVERHLVSVPWMPRSAPGQSVQVTRLNGVDQQVRALSAELDALPAALKASVLHPSGGYAWRSVAGERQRSPHSWGIAIDIHAAHGDYWRWSAPPRPGADPLPRWRNRIPPEVVAIFERHGFIWGGRWQHHDTMHFEYRPELLLL
jgi:hypothetical protein